MALAVNGTPFNWLLALEEPTAIDPLPVITVPISDQGQR